MIKRALITGVTGQDGSYLAEYLLDKEYEVYGLQRRTSQTNTRNIEHIRDKITLFSGDLLDMASLLGAVEQSDPHEVYNLAGFSHVGESFRAPVACFEQTGLGAIRLLEAVRYARPNARFYQASSSEMFGNVQGVCDESTPFHPRSPYGCAKLAAHAATVNYREAYGLHASCGILFNHESPRRGEEFVTRKIARAAARGERVKLGNLSACRDWGWAPDYVHAMWLMLQQEVPDDFVIATGESHSVAGFCQAAYGDNWASFVDTDVRLYRPAEIDVLCGDASKAKRELGWVPTVGFEELVKRMVYAERVGAKNQGECEAGSPGV